MATIINNIIRSLDHKTKCNCVLLDLSNAFDCIQHDILMDKLYKYGVWGILHKLIASYLRNRIQHVKVTHTESNQTKEYLSGSLSVKYGVPQGSVLGPVGFSHMVVWQPLTRRWTRHTENVAGSSDVSSKNAFTRQSDYRNHSVRLGIRCVPQCKFTSELLMMWERWYHKLFDSYVILWHFFK
jgi:hypothetical protein